MTLIDASTYRTDTVRIVQDVLALMLGYTVEPSGDEPADGDGVGAAVYFAGAWKGAAVLQCSPPTSRKLCAQLMTIPEPAEVDEDTLETMGELINMVGGNLKAFLPHGVALTPPAMTRGSAQVLIGHEDNARAVFGFTCEAGPFWVTLVQCGLTV